MVDRRADSVGRYLITQQSDAQGVLQTRIQRAEVAEQGACVRVRGRHGELNLPGKRRPLIYSSPKRYRSLVVSSPVGHVPGEDAQVSVVGEDVSNAHEGQTWIDPKVLLAKQVEEDPLPLTQHGNRTQRLRIVDLPEVQKVCDLSLHSSRPGNGEDLLVCHEGAVEVREELPNELRAHLRVEHRVVDLVGHHRRDERAAGTAEEDRHQGTSSGGPSGFR